jgi:hypothetical protein
LGRKLAAFGSVFVCLVVVLPAQEKPGRQGGGAPKPAAAAPASPKSPTSAPAPAEDVVREWFRRWNAVDGSAASIKRLVEMYQPAAIHQLPPSPKQIGPVFMEGHDAIQKMAEDFARASTMTAFRIEATAGPGGGKPAEIFYKSQGPWGGPAIAVSFVAAYTDRASRKRHTYPGFAIFHIEAGKIRYARFYSSRDENRED